MDYAIEFVNRLKIVLSFLKKNKGKYSSQIEIIEELVSIIADKYELESRKNPWIKRASKKVNTLNSAKVLFNYACRTFEDETGENLSVLCPKITNL